MMIQSLFKIGISSLLIFSGTSLNAQWTIQTSGTQEDLRAVHFPTSTTGFACGSNGTILKTTNSGTTWTGTLSSYPGYVFWDIQFLSATTGYAVGESDPGSNPSGSAVVLKTTDGGTNWNSIYDSPSHPLRDLFVVDAQTIYAAGGAESIMGAQSVIIKSTDGGNSWSTVGFYSGSEGAGVTFGGMYFKDANTGFLASYDFLDKPHWLATTDGGSSFDTTTCAQGAPGYWNFSSDFADSQNGYMLVSTSQMTDHAYLRRTTNGGTSWTETELTGVNGGLLGIDFIGTEGYIVGADGTILKTTNGGSTFVSQTSPTHDVLRDVHFVNADLGFAVGTGGTILRYNPGGTAGIDETAISAFKVFPNPATDNCRIEAGEVIESIEIMDLTGKLVEKIDHVQQLNTTIDVSNYSGGAYILKIHGAQSMEAIPLHIQ